MIANVFIILKLLGLYKKASQMSVKKVNLENSKLSKNLQFQSKMIRRRCIKLRKKAALLIPDRLKTSRMN